MKACADEKCAIAVDISSNLRDAVHFVAKSDEAENGSRGPGERGAERISCPASDKQVSSTTNDEKSLCTGSTSKLIPRVTYQLRHLPALRPIDTVHPHSVKRREYSGGPLLKLPGPGTDSPEGIGPGRIRLPSRVRAEVDKTGLGNSSQRHMQHVASTQSALTHVGVRLQASP
jgi:hypothetical protein